MLSSVFQPRVPTRRFQWAAMLLVALMVSNVLMRGPLPFSAGYRFPVRDFFTLLFVIFVICEANKAVYRYLDRRLPFDEATSKRLAAQVVASFLATIVLFIPLHVLIASLSNEPLSPRTFLFYGFVACSISAVFNGAHIIVVLVRLVKYREQGERSNLLKTVSEIDHILSIETGNRTLMLDPRHICWWHSSGGTVSLVKTDGVRFTTNYSSFAMIAPKLPQTEFFHLTRQVIAHRKSIDSIQHGQNGQLIVSLRSPDPGSQSLKVVVSRYKKAEFQAWLDRRTS